MEATKSQITMLAMSPIQENVNMVSGLRKVVAESTIPAVDVSREIKGSSPTIEPPCPFCDVARTIDITIKARPGIIKREAMMPLFV